MAFLGYKPAYDDPNMLQYMVFPWVPWQIRGYGLVWTYPFWGSRGPSPPMDNLAHEPIDPMDTMNPMETVTP